MKVVFSYLKKCTSGPLTPAIVASCLLFILYIISMPTTVQEGDSAELVLAGVNLSLAHPPGYPLQVFYNFICSKILFFLTPYQASSIGTIVLATFSSYLITILVSGWRGCLVAILWGTSFLAWKWAILPDVFSGFTFFSILFLTLLKKRDLITKPFTFLLALSVLHQQLIIFLLPVLIYVWWPHRKNKKNNAYIAFYGFISLSGYLTLFLMDDTKPGSWGVVDNFTDLWNHFSRHDYGTTSLSPNFRKISWNHNLRLFLSHFFESFWSIPFIATLIWHNSSKKITNDILILSGIIASYLIIVILRSSFDVDSFGIATLERFFLFPFLLLLVITFIHYKKNPFEKIIFALIFCNITTNIFLFANTNFYRNDKRVHDWATSLLMQTPTNSILWVSGDTEVNAARYLQQIEGMRSDVIIMSSLDQSNADLEKVIRLAPQYFAKGESWANRINWADVKFFSNDINIAGFERFDRSVIGLIAQYYPGNGQVSFNCFDKSHYQISKFYADYLRIPDIRSALVFSYGNCHLNAANQNMKTKNWSEIKTIIKTGLEIISPHPLLQLQLCLSIKLAGEDASSCEEQAATVFANTHPAYLPKEFKPR